MPQNHDQQEEEDGNKAEGEEDEDYTPWSNAEKDRYSTTPMKSKLLEMKPQSPLAD
jgi:hypothetical protein